ncbi:MAG: stage II sporulation protein M [Nanoarchaeota archaeon]
MRKKWLLHPRLPVRFGALFAVMLVCFLVSWTLSYYFLPEGILQAKTGAGFFSQLMESDNMYIEFLFVFMYNLIAFVFIIAASRMLKVKDYPLGYIIPVYLGIMYGAVLGTNSFATTLAERLAPSLLFLARSGIYEISAYTLMAVSTLKISLYRGMGFFPPRSEAITPRPSWKAMNWTGFVLAILLLFLANGIEIFQLFLVR